MGLVKEVHVQVVALIDEDEGQFGVSFPDFAGCTTIGTSLDDAVTRAAEVLAFHVEGLAEDGPLPVPRTLAALREDKSFRRDAKDALVALVPYAPPTRAVRINITLDESLLERVDRTAESLGETRSGFLAAAARKRLADAAS
jgi:predicted RNase H-like HicB family nuclease